MKTHRFNESAADADIRDKTLSIRDQLSIKMTSKNRRLKCALDLFEEQQLRRELFEYS
jgi:hypothetical protein